MELHSETAPTFYKLMRTYEHYTSKLQIPHFFVKKCGGILPKNATFRTNQCGKSWRVGIEKIGEHYFFTIGWRKFAEDVDLKLQESLMFKFLGDSVFVITVYEMTGCKKELYSGDFDEESRNFRVLKVKDENEADQEIGSCIGGRWKFVKELKQHNFERLAIPKDFAIGTGIATNRNVKLLDDQGRKWPVRVTDKGQGVFTLTAGWINFLKQNNISVRSVMSFEFVSGLDNVIEVRTLKVGEELFRFLKRRSSKRQLFTEDKTIDGTEHLENLDLKLESESGNHCVREEEGFHVERRKWRFSKELEKHHAHILDIPEEFVKGTGISRNKRLILLDGDGMKWPVYVTERTCGVFAMTTGWFDFLIGNKVVIGSMVSFEYVSDSENMIEARVLEAGKNDKELFSSPKRSKGTHPFSPPPKTTVHVQGPANISHQTNKFWKGNTDSKADGCGFRRRLVRDLKKHNAYRLYIPKDFAIETGVAKYTTIKLLDDQRRMWPVYMNSRNGMFCLTTGWFDFLMGNKVLVGSTISLESVQGSDDMIEVKVIKTGSNDKEFFDFQKTKKAQLQYLHKRCSDRAKRFIRKSRLKSEENVTEKQEDVSCLGKVQRFEKLLKQHQAYVLDIPKIFVVRTGISTSGKIKLQDAEGRIWPVSIRLRKCGVFAFTTGWFDFLIGNKVVIGSTVSFEYISDSENIIEARVLKVGRDEKELFSSAKRSKGTHPFSPSRTEVSQKTKNCQNGETGHKKGGCGFCRRLVRELKKHNAYKLYIPKDFAIETGIAEYTEIKLLDDHMRKWPVCLNSRSGMFCLTTGWFDFLLGNKVVVGSTISLESVQGSDDMIEVKVIKKGSNGEEFFDSQKTRKPQLRSLHKRVDHAKRLVRKSRCKNEVKVPEKQEDGSFLNEGRRFQKELKRHHAYVLDIPKVFAVQTGIATSGKMIELHDVKERIWPVSVKQRKCGSFAFVTGWFDFLKGNEVVLGSTISLEFIPGSNNITIRARVIKEGPDGKAIFSSGIRGKETQKYSSLRRNLDHPHKNKNGRSIKIKEKNEENDHAADGRDSGWKWKFSKKLKKHHKRVLDVPKDFAVGSGISRRRNIEVEDGEGRKWTVSLILRKCGMFALTKGWNEFLVGNKATIGSVVVFEIVPGSDNVVRARVHHDDKETKAAYFTKARTRKA